MWLATPITPTTTLTLLLAVNAVFAAESRTYNKGKSGISKNKIENNIIPGRFIVEFSDPAALRKRAPDGDHIETFYQVLNENGIQAKPEVNITSSIFDGTSFTTPQTTDPDTIKALDEVANIWPVRKIFRPDPEIHETGAAARPVWSNHINTGVLELHNQGILGEGATVAIVDTGVDYTHPALGGGFGAGFKVSGGIDIVGDDYKGGVFIPDGDPQDCLGHGTHVAGIVAGEDPNFIGVAPKAKLRAYKVFGCIDYTGDDALILAFVTAYEDGADVINASIGGPGGFPEDAWAAAASRIVEKGVFIAISAGNSGADGIWYPSSGSSGTEVTAVASIDNEVLIGFKTEATANNGTKRTIGYLDGKAKGFDLSGPIPLYTTSLDKTNGVDACTALPENTPDLSKYIVLVRRGGCPFNVKEQNLVNRGAKYIWFYNNRVSPVVYPSIEAPVSTGFALISADDGEFLIDQAKASTAARGNSSITIDFPAGRDVIAVDNALTGGKLSIFTSWGPTYEAQMKPEIAAPGGYIYSTYPMSKGGYAILSGTSMASPYIAGVAALYIGKAGGRGALGPKGIADLKKRIITSGTLINWNDGKATNWSILAPVAQQGAGYVNALKVLTYDTSVSPGKLELNDTAYFKGGHFINIKNSGKKEIVYTVTHEAAVTVNSFEPGFITPQVWPPTFINATASVVFSVTKFDVRPGTTNSFKVTITPPAVESTLFPIYSGRIIITGSNGEILSVPYQGIHGKLYDIDNWDLGGGYPLLLNDSDGSILTGPTNFTFSDLDRPAGIFVNNFGTSEMRWDIVEESWTPRDWKYPPVPGENRFVGSVVTSNGMKFPFENVARSDPLSGTYFYYWNWAGALADGSFVKPGRYRFNFRSLRLTGRRGADDGWQSRLSAVVTVLEPPQKNATVSR